MKLTKSYYNSTSKVDTSNISNCIQNVQSGEYKKDLSNILKSMGLLGDIDIPLFVSIPSGKFINPYLVYRMYGSYGLPVEMTMEELNNMIPDFRSSDYWSEWCDFWLDTFLKGDMNKIKKNFIYNY